MKLTRRPNFRKKFVQPVVRERGKAGLFFADKFGNQIQVWKHAKYLVKQIGPLTPTNFASKNFHHHRTIHLTSQKPSTFQVDKIDQTNSSNSNL